MNALSEQDSDRLAKRLVAHHPFPGASHSAIEAVLARGTYRQLGNGTVMCEENQPSTELFFLVRGTIRVERLDTDGKPRTISTIDCPCILGHMGLIDGSKRSATCVAEGPVEVVSMSDDTVRRMLEETTIPGTALRRLLVSSLCEQLSSANAFVRDLVSGLADEIEAPDDVPTPPATPQRKSVDNNSIARLTAKLGGWDADLSELEAMEDEIEFVVDEDMKRRRDKRRQP